MDNRFKQFSSKLATRADYKFNDIKNCFAEPKTVERISTRRITQLKNSGDFIPIIYTKKYKIIMQFDLLTKLLVR